MRITHINTLDYEGGAAKAGWRLHEGLVARGHDSRLLVKLKTTAEPRVASLHDSTLGKAADRVAANLQDRLSLQDWWYPSASHLGRHPWITRADLIQLHNLHGQYFPMPLVGRLARQKPVVWLLHDMWALTGHCSFSYDCERWKTGCGKCPILHQDYLPLRRDTTALHWRLKRRVYAGCHLHLVAPSQWLAGLARESPLLGQFPVYHIPYGLDTELHRPRDQAAARLMLDLPSDAPVLLVSAHVLDDSPRKGANYLRAMLEQLRATDPALADRAWVLLVGFGPFGDRELAGIRCRQLSYIKAARMLTTIYAAADLLVMPTLADNLPLTIMEAMACGTPTVAFDSGGVRELVRHEETGVLVTPRDVDGLLAGVLSYLREPARRLAHGAASRDLILRQHRLEQQASAYETLYHQVIHEHAGRDPSRQPASAGLPASPGHSQ